MLAAVTVVALSSCRRVRTRCNFFMGHPLRYRGLGLARTKLPPFGGWLSVRSRTEIAQTFSVGIVWAFALPIPGARVGRHRRTSKWRGERCASMQRPTSHDAARPVDGRLKAALPERSLPPPALGECSHAASRVSAYRGGAASEMPEAYCLSPSRLLRSRGWPFRWATLASRLPRNLGRVLLANRTIVVARVRARSSLR